MVRQVDVGEHTAGSILLVLKLRIKSQNGSAAFINTCVSLLFMCVWFPQAIKKIDNC